MSTQNDKHLHAKNRRSKEANHTGLNKKNSRREVAVRGLERLLESLRKSTNFKRGDAESDALKLLTSLIDLCLEPNAIKKLLTSLAHLESIEDKQT